MPTESNEPLTELQELLQDDNSPAAAALKRDYVRSILARIGIGIKDYQNLVNYDEDLRRAGDVDVGLTAMAKPDGNDEEMIRDSVVIAENVAMGNEPQRRPAATGNLVPAIVSAALLSGGLIGGSVLLAHWLNQPTIQPMPSAQVEAFLPGVSDEGNR